jgi:hypothetical protein
MDLESSRSEVMDCIHMALDRINFLFYYLFNGTVSSSGYVVSDGEMINE